MRRPGRAKVHEIDAGDDQYQNSDHDEHDDRGDRSGRLNFLIQVRVQMDVSQRLKQISVMHSTTLKRRTPGSKHCPKDRLNILLDKSVKCLRSTDDGSGRLEEHVGVDAVANPVMFVVKGSGPRRYEGVEVPM